MRAPLLRRRFRPSPATGVATPRPRVGVLAFPGLLLALPACGGRSSLLDTSTPTETTPATCTPASSVPAARRYGDGSNQVAASLAADSAGYPVVAGALSGTLDLGGQTLTAPLPPVDDPTVFFPLLPLGTSLFVARLAPAGCAPFAVAFTPMKAPASTIAVALDAADGVFVTATYEGTVDFGGGALGAPAGLASAAVVALGRTGEHRWSRSFVGNPTVRIARPAPSADGSVVVGGTFVGTLTLDDGTVLGDSGKGPNGPPADGFVVKLDAAGAVVWWKILRLASGPIYAAVSVASSPDGDVLVGGQLALGFVADPMIDLGGGPETPQFNQSGFMSVFDGAGQHRFHHFIYPLVVDAAVGPAGTSLLLGEWDGNGLPLYRFDGSGASMAEDVLPSPATSASMAVGADGSVLLAGALLQNAGTATGATGIRALRLDPAGTLLWSRLFGDANGIEKVYIAVPALAPSGAALLAGAFTGTFDPGTGPLSATPGVSNGDAPDIFVATLPP